MTEKLGRIKVRRRRGAKRFKDGARVLNFDLLDFWGWSGSDLVANTARGILAEYVVARALCVDVSGVRDAWAPFDLTTPSNVKIEVKSAAYLQAWQQKDLSKISFRTPKTLAWDADTGQVETEAERQSDVYVFATLKHPDKATINPLDVSQWEFHALSTKRLDERTRSQHSITLRSLEALSGRAVTFDGLASAVEAAAHESAS